MPDAAQYGDAGADTFRTYLEHCGGLGDPESLCVWAGAILTEASLHLAVAAPGRLLRQGCAELSWAERCDHWGIERSRDCCVQMPFKTLSNGFPQNLWTLIKSDRHRNVSAIIRHPARRLLSCSATRHEATGKPIVYTSAESVFQIAINVDKFGLDTLYHYCEVARKMLVGDWACGRVIARPYIINAEGKRERTPQTARTIRSHRLPIRRSTW